MSEVPLWDDTRPVPNRREREATKHTHLLRERGGRAVCQMSGGRS
jgi:hypothetical protein